MDDVNKLNINREDFTFKDFIQHLKLFIEIIKKNLRWFFLYSILGVLFGLLIAFIDKPDYSAKTRFLMKETNGSASIMNSLGSLGSFLGGSAGMASTLERTLAIMGSEKLIGESLLFEVEINNEKDLLINHFIKYQDLHKDWNSDSSLKNISFSLFEVQIDSMSLAHRKAFKAIVKMMTSPNSTVLKKSYDKKSGVFDLIVTTSNQQLSIQLNKVIFKKLEDFIYNQTVNPSGRNVSIITSKIDSIKNELSNVQVALARNNDRTLGLIMQEDKVDQKQLMIKEQLLTIMYGEAQKNLETFKFLNQSINSGLEILEYPFLPLKAEKRDPLKFSVFGFILFSFLTFLYFLIKK